MIVTVDQIGKWPAGKSQKFSIFEKGNESRLIENLII